MSINQLTIAKGPIVVQAMTHFLIDCADYFHVGLAPLSTQVLGLHFQQLQHVQLHQRMTNFERSLQYGRRLEHHQHHDARMLPFGEFVQDAQQIDARENCGHAKCEEKCENWCGRPVRGVKQMC